MRILKYISISLPVIFSILILTACPGTGAGDTDDDGTADNGETHSLSVSITEQAQKIDIDEHLMLNAAVTDTSGHTTTVSWFINGVQQAGENAVSFNFSSSTAGDYTIKVSATCEADTQTAEVIITVEQILRFTETARYTAGTELDKVPTAGAYSAVDVDGDIILLVTLNDGVKYSTDSGTNWGTLSKIGNNLSDDHVYSVTIDPVNPDLWYFGTLDGLSVYNSTTVPTPTMNTSHLGVKVNDIVISGSAIYMATDSGVYHIADKTEPAAAVSYTTANGLPSDKIAKLDIYGTTIYAATAAGLASASKGAPSSWTVNNAVNGPLSLSVQDVYSGAGNTVCWTDSYVHISTDGGESWSAEPQPAGGGVTGNVLLGDFLYTVRSGAHLYVADATASAWYDAEINLPDPPFWFGYNCNGISAAGGSLFIVHNDGLLVGTVD